MAHIDSHGRVVCSHCGGTMKLWRIADHVGEDKRTVVYTCPGPCNGRATFGINARPVTTEPLRVIVREAHQRAPQHERRVGGKERHHAAFMQVPRSRDLARSGP